MKDDGKRVMDTGGHHVAVDLWNTQGGGSTTKAHVYVNGFKSIKGGLPQPGTPYLPSDKWYNDVTFKSVRLETDRTGSSQGNSIPSGNNTPSSTHSGGKGKSKSPAYGYDSAATAASSMQQWVAIPNDSYGREQFYNGQVYVAGMLRYPDGRGGYVYSDANGQFPVVGSGQASGSQAASTRRGR